MDAPLSKIRQKILNMSLRHIEPGSEAAKKFDNSDVFWDTLGKMCTQVQPGPVLKGLIFREKLSPDLKMKHYTKFDKRYVNTQLKQLRQNKSSI